jgi:O-antigen/teichoic acid export membrane protein
VWHSPAFTTWASLATRSLSVVLVLPLVLRQFGAEEVALWQIFTSLMSLQLIADMGFGITGARMLAYAMGGATNLSDSVATSPRPTNSDPNWSLIVVVLATLRVIFNRLGWILAIALSVGGTLTLLRPISQLNGAQPHEPWPVTNTTQAWIAWGVVFLTTVITFRANLYSAFLQGINEVALLRRWETLFGLGAIGSSFLVLSLRGGLLALVLSNQLWIIGSAWRNRRIARRVLDGRFAQFPAPQYHPEVFAAIWPRAWRSAIGALMSQGLMQLSSLIYAQQRDSKAVATYLLAVRLIQALTQISQAPFYTKLPVMAKFYAENRTDALVSLARRGMALAFWSFTLPFIILGALGNDILNRIGSPVTFPDPTLWTFLGLAAYTERQGAMHIQLYTTTNHIVWHIANGVAGTIFIITAWLAFPYLGVLALPIGMLMGNLLFYCPYSAFHSYRRFSMPFPKFEMQTMFGPLVVMIVVWFSTLWLK